MALATVSYRNVTDVLQTTERLGRALASIEAAARGYALARRMRSSSAKDTAVAPSAEKVALPTGSVENEPPADPT